MTSLYLVLWIAGGILLQLVIYLAIIFWRHWRDYLALRHTAAALNIAVKPLNESDAPEAPTAAWSGLRSFRVERKVTEDAQQEICSFYLKPEDGQALAPFFPGQFLIFRLDIPSATGGTEPVVRCYSLSDAPRVDGYRVSIKRAPAPNAQSIPPGRSSNYFHDQVALGSLLQVHAPSGHFYIDRSDNPVILIGGGIGITPMLSMLEWCLTTQPEREIWLFYGVRNGREMVMKSHFKELAAVHPSFHLQVCFSDPQPDDVAQTDYQHAGRIDVPLLRRVLPLKPYHFYICGPTPMMESLVPALEDWGVPDGRIHFEAFGPASVKRKNTTLTALAVAQSEVSTSDIVVTFAKSGKQLPWQADAATLLDFVESHGIAVSSGCRAGGCGTCQTTIREGEVTYRQLPEFDPEPGTCLLCVCTPKTSVTLEI